MRNIKVLIIENDFKQYKRLCKICDYCKVSYFPSSDEEFEKLYDSLLDFFDGYYSKLVTDGIVSNHDNNDSYQINLFASLPQYIDIILLDVTLISEGASNEDNSGLVLKSKVLDLKYKKAHTLYVTRDAKESLSKKFSLLAAHDINESLKEPDYVPKDLFMNERVSKDNLLVRILNRIKEQMIKKIDS